MSQLLLINPRRRRRSRKASARRRTRARRPMSALQKKYFGGGRKSHARRARRRSRIIVASPNPIRARRRSRRKSRGFASLSGRRSYRRAMRSASGAIRASVPGIISAVKTGVVGGAGAIAVDMAMGQAARFLPATLTSRMSADGTMNWGYYGTKAMLAIGLAVVGQGVLPARMKAYASHAAAGSLTVMAYEILRAKIPASITLGYFNPATVTQSGNVTSMGKYLSRGGMGKYLSRGMGASFPGGSSASRAGYGIDARVGEANVF